MNPGLLHANHHRLGLMSGIMSGEAARSLALLRAIDGTVEALVYTRRNMEALCETCESLIRRAETESMEGELLVEEVIPSLAEVKTYSRKALEIMQVKYRSARSAPELGADDGVVEAYEQVIGSIAELISKVDVLMSTINERLAQSGPSPLERKRARTRPSFLARDVLDKVVKEHTAYFCIKANDNDPNL